MLADLKKNTEQKMKKSIEVFKGDLGKVRTGGRTPACSITSASTITACRRHSTRWRGSAS